MQYLPNERAKEIALSLIPEIEADSRFVATIEKKGVMFGILVCRDGAGEEVVLKAFSGQIGGSWVVGEDGEWCPPLLDISAFDRHVSETDAEIHRLTDEIEKIENENPNLKGLGSMSGRVLSPDEKATFQKILSLKEKRRELSKSSMQKIFSFYKLHCVQSGNPTVGRSTVGGESVRKMQFSFHDIFGEKLPPTGTGECCAPKLLNRAAILGLQPVSMCEFFLGGESDGKDVSTTLDMTQRTTLDMTQRTTLDMTVDSCHPALSTSRRRSFQRRSRRVFLQPSRVSKYFYDPCDEKCKPLMKYLLGLDVVYFDKDIIVVNKPSGLLSVPGRGEGKQDCVVNRVKFLFSEYMKIEQPSVHRLDMDTSGLLVLAFTEDAHRNLNRQFEEKTVEKKYIAVLSRPPAPTEKIDSENKIENIVTERDENGNATAGRISLPFRVDIENRPCQIFDPIYGKVGITNWRWIGTTEKNLPIIEFIPETGRTHQLRLCAASKFGLNAPILGDDLYGNDDASTMLSDRKCRLMLHAQELSFTHPATGERMSFRKEFEILI